MVDTFDLLSRWLHMLAAMGAVGGMLFMRFALLPATAQLATESRDAHLQAVHSRWAKAVMAASWAKRDCSTGLRAGSPLETKRQRWMRLSAPAARIWRPSGVKATAFNSPWGWLRVSSRAPSETRQSFTV